MGALKRCENLEQLAHLIHCDPDVLSATFNWPLVGEDQSHDQSDRCESSVTERLFKRRLNPPFYAILVTGALFHTQGGLSIDEHCRVLRPSGEAFQNLWAAGGAARGVSGHAVWGYLSGNGLLSALAGGYIAAQSVTQQLSSKP
jgi:fumarate reductase flavoprotein subunit